LTIDYRALLNALPGPCLVLLPDFTIEALNDACLRAAGCTRAALIGQPVFALYPEQDGAASERLRASLRRIVQGADIDRIPGDSDCWNTVNTALRDNAGALTHILHRHEDVTDLVHAQQREARLREQMSTQTSEIDQHQKLADWFTQAPSFMAVLTGPEHRVDNVNPGYLQLVGQRDIVGKTIAAALPDAAAQGYVTLLDEVYRSGMPYTATSARYQMQATPEGPVSERYVDFVFQPIRAANDAVRGIFIQGVDVTDRVLADIRRDALIRLTHSLRELRTPEEITYTAAVVLGETLGVARVGYGTIDPEAETLTIDRDWTAPGVAGVAGTLMLRDYGSFIDDLKLGNIVTIDDVATDLRTAGKVAQLKVHSVGALVNLPILEQGRLVALIFVNDASSRHWLPEDIALIRELAERTRTASERLRVELSLQHSEAKFRTIADAMPQMVWSTLPDGSHDYFNRRWYDFTGVPEGSTDGAGWSDMFHPDDRERTWERWHRSLASGIEYEIQYRLRDRNGQYRWVLGRAVPIYNDAGTLIRWMGTCTDIHEQKLAEEELRRASESKDEFLAMLAHELRNPLAPIASAAQLLKVTGIGQEKIRLASEIIGRQVRHMTELVDDLLDVSRVARGLVELSMERLDIRTVVEGAVEQASPLIEARQHALAVLLPEGRTEVLGDKTRLVQALANLLNNAAKYTPKHGKITLSVAVAVAGSSVAISVSDNGNGIDAALMPYVFDLFTQGARTPDRAHGGLGLGLTLVKRIAHLHGGEVSATSAGTGQGSTFTITMPMAEPLQGSAQ
jgi:PAS domain S-box-containing protein